MDVRCERCKTEYELSDAQVTETGVPVKCTSCGYVFRVKKKALVVTVPLKPGDAGQAAPLALAETPEPARGRTWRIRQAEGSVVLLKELTTLQRWIVEKKVGRDDQISLTGETWKKLGEIPELGPFFQVVEDAALGHQLLRKQALAAQSVPPLAGPSSIPLDSANPFPRAASGEHPSIPPFAQALSTATPVETALAPRGPRDTVPEPARAVRSAARRSDADFPAELSLDFNRSRRRGSWLVIFFLLLVIAGVVVYGLGLWRRVPLVRAWVESVAPGAGGAPELDAGVAGAKSEGSVPVAGGVILDAGTASSVGTGDAGVAAPLKANAPVIATPSRTAQAIAQLADDAGVLPPASGPPAPEPSKTTDAPPDTAPNAAPEGLADVAPAVPLGAAMGAADAGAAAKPAPPHDFDYFMARGDRLRQRDRAAAAMDAYGRAVDLSPDRAEGYAGRGLSLLDLGNGPLAEASFQQALKLNPRYSVALMGLAETYRVMNKKPEAIRYYQKFLDVVPSGTEASAAKVAIQKLREPHE